jgi:hypothetical protein
LPYAISLAEEHQAQLVIFHVIEQPSAGILDLQAVTASLMRRPMGWCHPKPSYGVARNACSSSVDRSPVPQSEFWNCLLPDSRFDCSGRAPCTLQNRG